jgi:hypothetical protein
VAVINISHDGQIKDGGSTTNERTRVEGAEPVTWNAEGKGPWAVVFCPEGSPLIGVKPGEEVYVPKDGKSDKGRSKTYPVKFGLPNNVPFRYDVRRHAGRSKCEGERAGPEIIVESGGPQRKSSRGKKTAAAARRGQKTKQARTGSRKAATRTRKATKSAGKRSAKKR